jgi:uncharacterized RDD family membrane protein YckC
METHQNISNAVPFKGGIKYHLGTGLLIISVVCLIFLNLAWWDFSHMPEMREVGKSFIFVIFHLFALMVVVGLALRNFNKWLRSLSLVFLGAGVPVFLFRVTPLVHGVITKANNVTERNNYFFGAETLSSIILIILGIIILMLAKAYRPLTSKESNDKDLEILKSQFESNTLKRSIAALLDYFFVFNCMFLTIFLFGEQFTPENKPEDPFPMFAAFHPSFLSFYLSFWIWIIYFPIVESIFRRTPGKAILGLRVVRDNPQDSFFKVSFLRHLFDWLDFGFFGLLGILLITFTKKHKRIGDLVANSRVVSIK